MAIFALTGISGNVGKTIANELLAAGHVVRAIVRNSKNERFWNTLGVQTVISETYDLDKFREVFTDVDGVYIMTPTWFQEEDMFSENIKAVSILHKAISITKPNKVVLLSSIGAQHSSGTGPVMKLHHMENVFADIEGVTSVRAAWFMENFSGLSESISQSGIFTSMLAPAATEFPMVATKDIGLLIAEILVSDQKFPSYVELEGPKRYSPEDVANAFGIKYNKYINIEIMPQKKWKETFAAWGLSGISADAMVEMINAFNNHHMHFEGTEKNRFYGKTSISDFVNSL